MKCNLYYYNSNYSCHIKLEVKLKLPYLLTKPNDVLYIYVRRIYLMREYKSQIPGRIVLGRYKLTILPSSGPPPFLPPPYFTCR